MKTENQKNKRKTPKSFLVALLHVAAALLKYGTRWKQLHWNVRHAADCLEINI